MSNPIRSEQVAGHEVMVIDTMVKALRAAFSSQYPEDEFANLQIDATAPQDLQDFPFLRVDYDPDEVTNFGVGHKEYFRDQDGILREWMHRRFIGDIIIEIHALSPLDRAVLSDAVIDLFSFGRLTTIEDEFFNTLYGNSPDDLPNQNGFEPEPRQPLSSFLSQLVINTDQIVPGIKNADPAPWDSGNDFVYSTTVTAKCHGGFYNKPFENDEILLIRNIQVEAATDTSELTYNPDVAWLPPTNYYDKATVSLTLGVSSNQYIDAATVSLKLTPSGVVTKTSIDAATVVLRPLIKSIDGLNYSDSATVSLTLTTSGSDHRRYSPEAATVALTLIVDSVGGGHIFTDAADVRMYLSPGKTLSDSATVSLTPTVTSVDTFAAVDASTVSLSFTITSTDVTGHRYSDSATVSMTPTSSGTDALAAADAGSVQMTLKTKTATETFSTPAGTDYTDADTVVLTLTASGTDGFGKYDHAVVTMTLTVSGSDALTHSYSDAATVSITLNPRRYVDSILVDLQPVSFWKMDETSTSSPVADSVGANNGSYISFVNRALGGSNYPSLGNPALGVAGSPGTSMISNYTSSVSGGGIQIPYASNLNTAAFSIASLIKPFSSSTVALATGTIYTAQSSSAGFQLVTYPHYTSNLFNGTIDVYLTTPASGTVYNSTFTVSTSGSHVLVLAFDGSTITAYMDNTSSARTIAGSYTPNTIKDSFIGCDRAPTSGYYFAAAMQFDNLAYFNRALTSSEAKSIYDAAVYGYGNP